MEDPSQDVETPPEEPQKKKRGPRVMALRILFAISGTLLLLGFFFPWVVSIGAVTNLSGFELVMGDILPGWQKAALAMCPVVGLAQIGCAAVPFRGFRWVGIVSGLIVLAYGIFTVLYIVFKMIDLGIWMALLSSAIALGAGLALAPKKTEPEPQTSDAEGAA